MINSGCNDLSKYQVLETVLSHLNYVQSEIKFKISGNSSRIKGCLLLTSGQRSLWPSSACSRFFLRIVLTLLNVYATARNVNKTDSWQLYWVACVWVARENIRFFLLGGDKRQAEIRLCSQASIWEDSVPFGSNCESKRLFRLCFTCKTKAENTIHSVDAIFGLQATSSYPLNEIMLK